MLTDRQKELSNEIWEQCSFEDNYNVRYSVSTGVWGKKFRDLLAYIHDEVGPENRALILNDLNEDGFSIVSMIGKYQGFIGDYVHDIIDELLNMGAHPVASAQCLTLLFSSPGFIFDKFLFILDKAEVNGSPVVIKGHDGNPFHDPEFLKGYIFWSIPPDRKEDIKSSKKWLEQRRDSDGELPVHVLYDQHFTMVKELGPQNQYAVSTLVLNFLESHLDATDASGIPLWVKVDRDINDGVLVPNINLPSRVASFIEERRLSGATPSIEKKIRKPHRL